jgi:hypothetical protein
VPCAVRGSDREPEFFGADCFEHGGPLADLFEGGEVTEELLPCFGENPCVRPCGEPVKLDRHDEEPITGALLKLISRLRLHDLQQPTVER